MSAQWIGLLSGGLVVVSAVPYCMRIYQGKIFPSLTSFSLWSFIGFALLITYRSAGAQANVWPAVFGFTNPLIIAALIVRQRGKLVKPNRVELACLIIGVLALLAWVMLHNDSSLVPYALYLAIVADGCAAVPTIVIVWLRPYEDRPFAWMLFALAYGLALFAVPDHSIANLVLPTYMLIGSLSIAFPLVLYRWKNNVPLREWL